MFFNSGRNPFQLEGSPSSLESIPSRPEWIPSGHVPEIEYENSPQNSGVHFASYCWSYFFIICFQTRDIVNLSWNGGLVWKVSIPVWNGLIPDLNWRVLIWKEFIPDWNVFAPYPKTSTDLSQIVNFPKHLLTVGNGLGITLKTLFKVQLLGLGLGLDNKTNFNQLCHDCQVPNPVPPDPIQIQNPKK